MNKKKKIKVVDYQSQSHAPLMSSVAGIPGVTAAPGVTSIPTSIPENIIGPLNVTGSISATGGVSGSNLSGTNTGDETTATIKTKLGAASSGVDGYLTGADWNTFNGKADKGLTGTKIYYVADTPGGANLRKLTFIDGVLSAEV